MEISQLLSALDPELSRCIAQEEQYQKNTLQLIASESLQSEETLLAAACAFANRTAVGNIGNQRLKGAKYADALEQLAAERACRIFGADHANLTPYSGSMANFCAYGAVMQPGDTALALDPAAGAHQSHGGAKNITSKMYRFSFFGLDRETLDIDYGEADRLARELHPKLIVVGSAAYPRKIDYARLSRIAHENGAYLMADIAHFTGLVAAGLSPNPIPHADIVTGSTTKTLCGPHSGFVMCSAALCEAVEKSIYPGHVASLHLQTVAAMAFALQQSQTPAFRKLMGRVVDNAQYLCKALENRGFGIFTGGTDCHMFLADLTPFGIDGKLFADLLEKAGILVNSKALPFDKSPLPMGIRAGTTVLTQRGMGHGEMDEAADLLLALAKDPKCLETVKQKAQALAMRFPEP